MMLTSRQEIIASKVIGKHLPNQDIADLHRTKRKKHFGVNIFTANILAQSAARSIFGETPNISQARFEKKLIPRVKLIRRQSKKFAERAFDSKAFVERINEKNKYFSNWRTESKKFMEMFVDKYTCRYFRNIGKTKLPIGRQVKSFDYHTNAFLEMMDKKPVQKGEFSLTHEFPLHDETNLALVIRDNNGEIQGTLGGFYYLHKKNPVFRLTNIQGETTKQIGFQFREEKEKNINEHLSKYRKLNQALGENWRLFLVNQLIKHANEKRMMVVGELPEKYSEIVTLATESEHKRQIRQYKQTYRKTGFVEQKNWTWHYTPKANKGETV